MGLVKVQNVFVPVLLCVQIFGFCLGERNAPVFENGQNDNGNKTCDDYWREYQKGLEQGSLWALKMADSSAQLQSGIFSGNLQNLGSFEQCVGITANTSTGFVRGKYCIGDFTLRLNYTLENSPKSMEKFLQWALCIPDACKGSELSHYYSEKLSEHLNEKIVLDVNDKLCQNYDNVNPPLNLEAKITLGFLLVLILTVLSSTSYEIYTGYREIKPKRELFVAFSIVQNGRQLIRTTKNPEHLMCFDGIRSLSMMWIIFLHEFSSVRLGPILHTKDYDDWTNSLHSMFAAGAGVAVDTFFVLSGFLVSYTHLKKEDTSMSLLKYYSHRFLRLTPSLAATVLISATLLKYAGSGPYWQLFVENLQKPCQTNWWTTLLYVQNYVNDSKMCVGHAWYLAVDMQLFLLSPLFLYIFKKSPKIGLFVISVVIVTSISFAFYSAWGFKLTAIVTNKFGKLDLYMNNYYLLTHTRASSWLIGLIFGAILLQLHKNAFKINKVAVVVLWIASISTMILCIFGGHHTLRGQSYNRWGNAFHIALVKPSWCLSVCWVIFACLSGHGGPVNTFLSIRPFQILSKLSYNMYLVHVTCVFMRSMSSKQSLPFSDLVLIFNFWGDFCLAFFLAIIWMLMFEAPVLKLEKLFYKNR